MSRLDKALKLLGQETVIELEAMDVDQLKMRIVEANAAMNKVAEELELNVAYQDLKANKTALEAGKNEVNKRQRAIILAALSLLGDK